MGCWIIWIEATKQLTVRIEAGELSRGGGHEKCEKYPRRWIRQGSRRGRPGRREHGGAGGRAIGFFSSVEKRQVAVASEKKQDWRISSEVEATATSQFRHDADAILMRF